MMVGPFWGRHIHSFRVKTLHGESRLRAYAALVLAVGGITWSAIFVRWAGAPGPVSAFYRVLIAAAVLIPWRLAVTPKPRAASPLDQRRARWIAVAGGVFFELDVALWNTAVMRTQAAVASLLSTPMVAPSIPGGFPAVSVTL